MIKKIEKVVKRSGKYPHHYLTASGLTVFAVCIGELHFTVIVFFWVYAFVENWVDDTDDKVKKAIDWLLGLEPEGEREEM